MTDVIGVRIRDLRERRGLSLSELAPKLGMTKQALSKIERGEFAPSIDALRVLASEFDVPVSAFLEEAADGEIERLREQGHHLLAVMGKADLKRAIAVLEALARTRSKSG